MIALRRGIIVMAAASILVCGADADSGGAPYVLESGEVRFVCEGEEVRVPAWGQFSTVEGALRLDPQNLERVEGSIDVFMMSIRTDDAAWDTMFRGAGFLGIGDHPRARFVVDEVRGPRRLERGKWVPMTLKGHFMLHGITRKIDVPATARWTAADADKKRREQIRVRASFHIEWDGYDIAMPTGSTRHFAGDGAQIQADLLYELSEPKERRAKRR